MFKYSGHMYPLVPKGDEAFASDDEVIGEVIMGTSLESLEEWDVVEPEENEYRKRALQLMGQVMEIDKGMEELHARGDAAAEIERLMRTREAKEIAMCQAYQQANSASRRRLERREQLYLEREDARGSHEQRFGQASRRPGDRF